MTQQHDLTKQPKWVQKEIAALHFRINALNDNLKRIRKAHYLLKNHEWFTITNPSDDDGLALYTAHKNSVCRIAWIGKGDILLIGRKKNESQSED